MAVVSLIAWRLQAVLHCCMVMHTSVLHIIKALLLNARLAYNLCSVCVCVCVCVCVACILNDSCIITSLQFQCNSANNFPSLLFNMDPFKGPGVLMWRS